MNALNQFQSCTYMNIFGTDMFEHELILRDNIKWLSMSRGHWIMVRDLNGDLEPDDPCRIPIIFIREATPMEREDLDEAWYRDPSDNEEMWF